MIDERQQELASLYALDLLEGDERAAFEADLATQPELRDLVESLRTSASELTHTAPAFPPSPTLRSRILNSAVPVPTSDSSYSIPTPPPWIGWTAAACFLFISLFFAAKSFNVRGELQATLVTEQAARLEAGTLKNLLEAERILSRAQLDRLADAERQIADLRTQAALDHLHVTTLQSPSGHTPPARAIAVWNPARQEGLLVISPLPAPSADHDYQLWLIDPQLPQPISAGVLTIDTTTNEARLSFKPSQTLSSVPRFAVSLEPLGGSDQPTGPMVLSSE